MTIDALLSPQLNHDCWVKILSHCDEPTRDCTLRVSKNLHAATQASRYEDYLQAATQPGRREPTILPTPIELADRGCRRPDWRHIAKTLQFPLGHDKPSGLPNFYAQAGDLLDQLGDSPKGHVSFTSRIKTEFFDQTRNFGMRNDWGVAYYIGEWREARYHGFGVLTCSDGSIYQGAFEQGVRQGFGEELHSDGSRYAGDWKLGTLNGKGIELGTNGERYEGEFYAGRRHGHGVLTAADGSKTDGEWKFGSEQTGPPVTAEDFMKTCRDIMARHPQLLDARSWH